MLFNNTNKKGQILSLCPCFTLGSEGWTRRERKAGYWKFDGKGLNSSPNLYVDFKAQYNSL